MISYNLHRTQKMYLHCANHPCSVTAPLSSDSVVSDSVVSGNLWFTHGFPGEVLNTSSNSEALRAPSWSCMQLMCEPFQLNKACLIECLKNISKELISQRA